MDTSTLARQFAPRGTLRVGVNFGNPMVAQKDPAGGAPRGVGPELARELARRLGLPLEYIGYDGAGPMADAVKAGAWDLAFLAADPARASEIAFTEPYMLIEGTYLVRVDSPLGAVADVDREGIRVAVGDKTAYELYLSRTIRHATLVKSPTSREAIARFLDEKLEAAAGVRQPLVAAAGAHPGLRVMPDSFMAIRQAAGVPRGRDAAAAYLHDFIEEAKASGFVQRALAASGAGDATVAPAAGSRR